MSDKETVNKLLRDLEKQRDCMQERADALSRIAEEADDLEGKYKEAIEFLYGAIASLRELS
jgi:hypothetical protein